jgi:recombination protein RecA
MDENKSKALSAALSQIEKQFGKGAIMKMGDKDVEKGIQVVSTGSLGLDMALGVGGLPARPRGRDLRPGIVGQDHAHAAGHRQHPEAGRHRRIHRCGARASIRNTPSASGVVTSELLLSQPDNGEQALEIADMLVRSGSVDCVVVDSVACPHAQGRDRGRDGRAADGPAGAPHEPGAAQADRQHQALPTRSSSSSTRSA